MKKVLILGLSAAVALAVLSSPALAGSRSVKPRTQAATATYYGTSGSAYNDGGTTGSHSADFGIVQVGGDSFSIPSWARSVKITITDKSGNQVDAEVGEYTPAASTGNSRYYHVTTICYATNKKYELAPHFALLGVNVVSGPCGNYGTPDVVTTGQIKVVFSSLA